MTDISRALNKLYERRNLHQSQAYSVFNDVLHGYVEETLLTALLVALKINGESPDEIAGAANAMVTNARPFPSPDYAFADIVGTGGDGHNTINISSAAAIVAAACGVKVAKHGNRSVSSKSGSADLFAACGINLQMSPKTARRCMDDTGLSFLFAPVYHTGMKYVMPVRKQLATRTLFNILGPLANPASPTHSLLGVYSPKLIESYAKTLILMGHKHAMIVHGDGLDELALHGESNIVHLHQGEVRHATVTASDFGLPEYPISAIAGDEPEYNRGVIMEALVGKGEEAHRAAIAMNCGALLVLTEKAKSFKDGAEQAMEAMRAGTPVQILEAAAKCSQTEVV